MQLLISVRSADEVEPARGGGADIIDVKEPTRGPLGAVLPATLAEILQLVPEDLPFSVALGDLASSGQVVATLAALQFPSRSAAPNFLKLGFAGVGSPELVRTLLTSAVQLTSVWRSPPLIIAVAYADAGSAKSLSAETISTLASESGAAGVLLDTYVKDGAGLLDYWSSPELAAWVQWCHEMHLLTGMAGSLGLDDIATVASGAPDVIGFRGAACEGGRSGTVSAQRVNQLRQRLDSIPDGAWAVQPMLPRGLAKRLIQPDSKRLR